MDTERPAPGWLLLLAQLPSSPSSARVALWRRLRAIGAAGVLNGAWVLPQAAAHAEFFGQLRETAHRQGGTAFVLTVSASPDVNETIVQRFRADRSQEYDELAERCAAFLDRPARLRLPPGQRVPCDPPPRAASGRRPGSCPQVSHPPRGRPRLPPGRVPPSRSGSAYTATLPRPASRQPRAIRTAISPRLAIRTLRTSTFFPVWHAARTIRPREPLGRCYVTVTSDGAWSRNLPGRTSVS
jgi:hypothetical protein